MQVDPTASFQITPDGALPKVSILIPTHNRPHYFELALKTALNQTYKNIEIIISDNSDDNRTFENFRAYQEAYPQLIYLRTHGTIGLQNFYNAFKLATGDYISYLMDDDLFHPEKIERMMNYFVNNPNVSLVTSFRQLIDKDGNSLPAMPGTEKLFQSDTLITGHSMAKHMLENGSNVIGEPTTAMMRRKDIPEGFGWFRNKQYRLLTDVATWLTVLAKGDCVYISEALSYFRIHEEQDQKNVKNVRLNASIEWFDLILDAYASNMFFDNKSTFLELMSNKLNGFRYYTQANAATDSYDDKTQAEIARVNARAEAVLAS
jgi:glycosyltransferase involved in cell wall biosynthesis